MDFCEICNKEMKKGNMRFHLKSQLHLKNAMKTENTHTEETHEDSVNEEINYEIPQPNHEIATTDDYLSDFNNITYSIQEDDKPKEVKKVMLSFYMTLSKKVRRNRKKMMMIIRLSQMSYLVIRIKPQF